MATMTISVSEQTKDWVQAQVDSGIYADSSDYIRELIDKDQRQRGQVMALQQAITEGLESGASDKTFDEIIHLARQSR